MGEIYSKLMVKMKTSLSMLLKPNQKMNTISHKRFGKKQTSIQLIGLAIKDVFMLLF